MPPPSAAGRRSERTAVPPAPFTDECTRSYDRRELYKLLEETKQDDVFERPTVVPAEYRVRDLPTFRPPRMGALPRDLSGMPSSRSSTVIVKPEVDVPVAPQEPAAPISYASDDFFREIAMHPIFEDSGALETSMPRSAPLPDDVDSRTATAPNHPVQLLDEGAASATAQANGIVVTLPPQLRKALRLNTVSRGVSRAAAACLVLGLLGPLAFFTNAQFARTTHQQFARAKSLVLSSVKSAVGPGVRLVSLDVSVEPPQATLLLDGHPASNPLRVVYPADGLTHELAASAPGLAKKTQRIYLDRDVSIVLRLTQ